jgi:hypothetical protein
MVYLQVPTHRSSDGVGATTGATYVHGRRLRGIHQPLSTMTFTPVTRK